MDAEKKTSKCQWCGIEYVWGKGSFRFCSNECYWKDYAKQTEKAVKAWRTELPEDYQDTDPARIPNQRALAELMAWDFDSDSRTGLLISGASGTGKTRSVLLKLQEILKRHGFRLSEQLIRISGDGFASYLHKLLREQKSQGDGYTGETPDEYIEKLIECEVLFFDEVDKLSLKSEWLAGFVFNLVNSRCEHRRPIIMASQTRFTKVFSAPGLKAGSRDEAIIRRLTEYFEPINFDV